VTDRPGAPGRNAGAAGPTTATDESRGTGGLPVLRSLAEVAEVVQRRRGVCVRFSRGPEWDRGEASVDYESGLELPGLSVNPLSPEPWWTRPLEDWLARQLCQYAHLLDDADEHRVAWLLVGDEVGRGPDCEPLLAEAVPLALVERSALDEAERRYRDRFRVERDSTGG
jgi:hypothetical protein